ncbi:RAxF-45 family protein [Paenibacillus anaericanus]|uniref:RAxF-45 family protein n=1 Tax=Paenibacillus TaxID=44249 RepID=UPI003CCC55A5
MDHRNNSWNRISQLPMAMFGIFYDVVLYGISLSIFTIRYPLKIAKCRSYLTLTD